ncbi:hypothetical protein KY314_02935 [Candidatus Woesearchaeota archaeon]|nr:hypothetical protein [Candidatus Woesearchaeota archaeon]
MILLLIKLAMILTGLVGLFFVGYKKGKKARDLDNLEKVLEDARQIKADERKRAVEPISVIDKRLRKYARD